MTKLPTLLFLFSFAYFCYFVPAANADNSNIPPSYQAAYQTLLEHRQYFLENRAEAVRNLNECDSYLNEIDKLMVSNISDSIRERLAAVRLDWQKAKNADQEDLENAEDGIRRMDDGLAKLEDDMKMFASLK